LENKQKAEVVFPGGSGSSLIEEQEEAAFPEHSQF
jgi:hypothetical protein